MKYLITESQLIRLKEQEFEGRYETQYNKEFMKKNAPTYNFPSLTLDDTVDVISGLIDGVPGIGNLISAGIDIIHSLAYAVRFYNAKTDDERIEMATMGIITLGAAAFPVQGNALTIASRQGVKAVIKKTPQEILLIGKQLGLYNKTVVILSKTKWKYNLLLVLAKIVGWQFTGVLTDAVKYVKDLINKITNVDVKKCLQSLLGLLNELVVDKDTLNTIIAIAKKLN